MVKGGEASFIRGEITLFNFCVYYFKNKKLGLFACEEVSKVQCTVL